jgi:hypothetical protein
LLARASSFVSQGQQLNGSAYCKRGPAQWLSLLDAFPLDVVVAEADLAAEAGELTEPVARLALQGLGLDHLKTGARNFCPNNVLWQFLSQDGRNEFPLLQCIFKKVVKMLLHDKTVKNNKKFLLLGMEFDL